MDFQAKRTEQENLLLLKGFIGIDGHSSCQESFCRRKKEERKWRNKDELLMSVVTALKLIWGFFQHNETITSATEMFLLVS